MSDDTQQQQPSVAAVAIDTDAEASREREKAQVALWQERIRVAYRGERQRREDIDKWRRYAAGRAHGDSESGLVRTNLVQSTMQALLPHIYAQNPEIAARPAESVDDRRYGVAKQFGRTLQIVLNHEMEGAGFKAIAKRSVLSAMTTALGWVKVSYQRDVRSDPLIARRLKDAQDNLEQVRALIDELAADDGSREEHLARQAELEQQVSALQTRVEVTVAEGLAFDRLLTEDVLVDASMRELQDYAYADWIAHRSWYTPQQAAAVFDLGNEQLAKARIYRTRQTHEADGAAAADSNPESGSQTHADQTGYIAAWEIWHARANTVLTLIEGLEQWAREPWQPTTVGEQWYPFFPLAFAWVDGERYPLSDVEQWIELQDEYNRTRTNFSEHRKRSLPGRIGRRDAMSDEDARRISESAIQELTLIDGVPGESLQNLIGLMPYAPIDPALYDTTPIRADLELVSGLQDAQRGAVYQSKTATEASIEQSGFATRADERKDNIEDWITRIARYSAEMLLAEMSEPQVQRIAGDGAVWPQLSKGEIFDLVTIDIRAGSTGKPDYAREQHAWGQLLPQLVPMISQIMQAQAQGNTQMADALRAILSETMRRFDIRLDLDEIAPEQQQQSLMGAGQPAASTPDGGQAQQLQGLQQQLLQANQPAGSSPAGASPAGSMPVGGTPTTTQQGE